MRNEEFLGLLKYPYMLNWSLKHQLVTAKILTLLVYRFFKGDYSVSKLNLENFSYFSTLLE